MALLIKTPIQMRFSDVDSFSHVSNVAQQVYFDLGKTDLFRELWLLSGEIERVPAVTVSVKTDFMAQVFFGDELEVTTQVEAIGHKSLTLCQRLMRGEQCCSESHSVMVCFDKSRGESREVPAAWREIIRI